METEFIPNPIVLELKPSRKSLTDILASIETESFSPFCLPFNQFSYSFCCYNCSMDSRFYDRFTHCDFANDSPFMSHYSSSTLLSQASLSPTPMDPVLPVRVENIDQPDDIYYDNFSHQLFDLPFTPDFTMDDHDVIGNENVKENIEENILIVESLLTSCSQLSKDRSDSAILSQPLSQRSQENPNILQVKSLDNSIYSSSYENNSQPLVIASQSSYSGSTSAYYGSTGEQSTISSSTQLDSLNSQQRLSQEGNCCRKHKKYLEKLANKPNKKIDHRKFDLELDVTSLYTPTHNGHLKPTFSHNMLCALAIYSHPNQQQEVSGVYKFLMECFPYFRDARQHWKNSLRHSLATCDWFEKSDHPRNAKKGFKYAVRRNRMNCLKCEIKKQCITDITKLHYRLSGLYVCSYLINMGLLSLNPDNMSQLQQAIRRQDNFHRQPNDN